MQEKRKREGDEDERNRVAEKNRKRRAAKQVRRLSSTPLALQDVFEKNGEPNEDDTARALSVPPWRRPKA